MIFVTAGTQEPFDRLLRMVDECAPMLSHEQLVVQALHGKYRPENFRQQALYPAGDFKRLCGEASIIISHAGVGTIITALSFGKPLVILPRQAALGEHRNDHQLSMISLLPKHRLINIVTPGNSLTTILQSLLPHPGSHPPLTLDYTPVTRLVIDFLDKKER